MSDLTPEKLAELKRLEQAATKGPWRQTYLDRVAGLDDHDGSKSIVHCYSGHHDYSANAQFIAALRNAAPSLIAAAEECERLRGLVDELQWGWNDEGDIRCSECWAFKDDGKHAHDCRLAKAIAPR